MPASDLDPGAKQVASQSGRQGPGQNLQVNLHCKCHGSHQLWNDSAFWTNSRAFLKTFTSAFRYRESLFHSPGTTNLPDVKTQFFFWGGRVQGVGGSIAGI